MLVEHEPWPEVGLYITHRSNIAEEIYEQGQDA